MSANRNSRKDDTHTQTHMLYPRIEMMAAMKYEVCKTRQFHDSEPGKKVLNHVQRFPQV